MALYAKRVHTRRTKTHRHIKTAIKIIYVQWFGIPRDREICILSLVAFVCSIIAYWMRHADALYYDLPQIWRQLFSTTYYRQMRNNIYDVINWNKLLKLMSNFKKIDILKNRILPDGLLSAMVYLISINS